MVTKAQKAKATRKLNIAPTRLPVRGRAVAAPLGGGSGASSYTYIRYAEDASGTGFSADPDNSRPYVAFKTTTNKLVNPVAADFDGLWYLFKGDPGDEINTVLHGIVDPTTEGNDGDHYINTATGYYFGPKASGTWPAGISMSGSPGETGAQGEPGTPGSDGAPGTPGEDGEPGANGVDGNTILYGAGAPSDETDGVFGNFFINTSDNLIYGPKGESSWPAGVSIIGPMGPAGPKGDKPGLTFIYSTNTNTGQNPGTPYIRFNHDNSSGTTEIAITKITSDGFDALSTFATFEPGGRFYFEQVNGNKRAWFTVTSIENNANHYEFGATFLSGVDFNAGEVLSLTYFDTSETQTYSDLDDPNLPPASTNVGLAVVLNNVSSNPTGQKCIAISDGTNYNIVGRAVIEHDNETHALVFPATGLTWNASNQGGFVRLTASGAHGLTSGVCDNKAKLHIGTASTGFAQNDLLFIPTGGIVSTTVIQTSFPWPGGTPGAPLISDAGDTVQLKPTKIPKLRNNSRIIVDANFIASGNGNKTVVAKFGGTDVFTPATITTAVNIHIPFEFYNKGVTNVQETRMGIASANGVGTGAAGAVLGTDTTLQTNLTFHFFSTSANELIGIRSRLIEVVH